VQAEYKSSQTCMHVWCIYVYVRVGMESRTVLVVLDVGHARSRRWIACAQRVVSTLGTVWVAVYIGSVAKSGSPQRGPSGDKKKTRDVFRSLEKCTMQKKILCHIKLAIHAWNTKCE
jgi:hypothetical protein